MEGSKCLAMPVTGRHDFESYLVATLPPDDDQMKAADVSYQSGANAIATIVNALTAKRFLVACKNCGMVLGGYAGKEAPEVVEEPPVPATA